jgi:hypothetical protein
MTAGKQLWRNRKERKEWARRLQSEDPGLDADERAIGNVISDISGLTGRDLGF